MTETIQTAMDRLMTISVEPQDYVAEDGLLYCGTCNTPKEAFFPNGIARGSTPRREPRKKE
jgi:DNA replication protein DnaC